ncbi:putative pre-mRNA splicing protein [Chaetomium strumarium]|uniref:Pre-mRNA splicing protein n=1 Tax=Chaetomium strumarium TaxID=1170767 RepID=A0AAJ0GV82_9PEZI|nr:putative pre-mRNA splicing protein [Chaetomium strumarium]
MPSDKAAYLAAHYLTAETKPSSSKKRKRKQTAASSGLIIADDDETGWDASRHKNAEAEDDDIPMTIAGTTTEFRRAKKSGWKTIAGSTSTNARSPSSKEDAASAAAADAIIASVAAERTAAAAAEEAEAEADIPLMSNGAQAGLQSAAALSAQLRRRQQLEAEELAALKRANQQQQEQEEVILRDATGRRVDASLRRAEMRRQQQEAERAAREKQELLRGEVQAAQAKERRERLEEAALIPLARGKDDAELNEELKRRDRWNDPMAPFLGANDGDGGGGGKGKKKRAGKRPVYTGPAPPNRYGIRPGYRWDGVDRGNGFEAERFKALNRREMNKGLDYAWQMDE